jgi:hypothetical protein
MLAPRAWATGGPENVLLVVNPRSQDSLTIANHYAALRHIPASNFLYINWDPTAENTDIVTFREKVLLPVLRMARLPVAGRQIDYVVYSSDFPWGVIIGADMKDITAALDKAEETKEIDSKTKATLLKTTTQVASLTGLTYLWELALTTKLYFNPACNWYAVEGPAEKARQSSLQFSSFSTFDSKGAVVNGHGRHYLLSMMLGVTSGRGNTRQEVLDYLARSAPADGKHPKGTIYFMRNDDIRSKVRDAGFPEAVQKLKVLGVAAEIVQGELPQGKRDVQGVMTGVRVFDWKAANSTIRPGAICEHFTSSGGDLRTHGDPQTPLCDWLRYGAAAASGTVTEPYACFYKFPAPMMQVHYARGCTVAESFYQAVLCPYQLLVVGDPLCRPWANIPEISIDGLPAGGTVRGNLKLTPKARFADDVVVEHFEMVLDGVTILACPADGSFDFNSAALSDGAHEVRIVAVSKGPLPAWGEKIIALNCANHDRTIQMSCFPAKTVSIKKSLIITVKSPQSKSIQVTRGTMLLGRINGESGQIEVPASRLGSGPVEINAVGQGGAGIKSNVLAQPLEITVDK